MNSQTKQRYISTSIWSDDWFDSLSEREKLVYFYLLTNEHTNAAGVYQCTMKNVRLEIGLGREEIERIMAKFAEAGKAYYFREYIIIPKWLLHQKIKERSGLFLGMVKVLKGLPDEVKAFISDRRHYDYDVSEYIGNFYTPSQDPLLKNDGASLDPPPKNGRPSIEPPQESGEETGEHPPESTPQKPHDLDLDLDLDSDLDFDFYKNIHTQAFEDPPPKNGRPSPETLSQHFIARWQQNADVFNCLARLKQPRDWQAFWKKNTMTLEQIDLAIDNFIASIKSGAIERIYIPSSPDTFVLNGWIARCLSPVKKPGQGHRIANDNMADEDIDKYFREA
jgi:hypothetical protein